MPHQPIPSPAPSAAPPPPVPSARRRARHVQDLAARPDLQRELRALVGRVQGQLAGRAVLEVGCGAGWWTAHLAQAAQAVVALDDDADLLRAAAGQAAGRYPPGRVRFVAGDLAGSGGVGSACDAGFAAFLAVAMGEAGLRRTLAALHGRLGPGARVVLIDERDAFGDDEASLRRRLRAMAEDGQGVRLDLGPHFWCLGYTL